ncbi:MAG TPA: hypothetical protein H9956_03915 [Candidatus Eisenbergiella pullicola]|nr:hypothetical protein [Candidatus Eisenbergiella pullicola]
MNTSEILFFGGIAIMAIAAVGAVAGGAVFVLTGRRLKRKLEEEYGKPQKL